MANVGYIRVSSVDQNSARQLDSIELEDVFESRIISRIVKNRHKKWG